MLLMLLMEQVMVSMMLLIARIVMLVSGASHKQEAGSSVTLHLVMVTDLLDPCHRSNILVQQLNSFRFLLLIIRQDSTLL